MGNNINNRATIKGNFHQKRKEPIKIKKICDNIPLGDLIINMKSEET